MNKVNNHFKDSGYVPFNLNSINKNITLDSILIIIKGIKCPLCFQNTLILHLKLNKINLFFFYVILKIILIKKSITFSMF